jgi:hypothetical protein
MDQLLNEIQEHEAELVMWLERGNIPAAAEVEAELNELYAEVEALNGLGRAQ